MAGHGKIHSLQAFAAKFLNISRSRAFLRLLSLGSAFPHGEFPHNPAINAMVRPFAG